MGEAWPEYNQSNSVTISLDIFLPLSFLNWHWNSMKYFTYNQLGKKVPLQFQVFSGPFDSYCILWGQISEENLLNAQSCFCHFPNSPRKQGWYENILQSQGWSKKLCKTLELSVTAKYYERSNLLPWRDADCYKYHPLIARASQRTRFWSWYRWLISFPEKSRRHAP